MSRVGAARLLAVLAVAVLASGCTRVVTGTVRPAPGLAPTPATGAAVRQVLLDDVELSKLADQPFRSDPNLPPRFGGVDQLPDGWASGVPEECVTSAVGAQRSVYAGSGAQDIAHEFWNVARAGASPVTGVAEGVVALPNAADAEALFQKLAEQWSHCDGITVIRHDGRHSDASGEITDVSTAGSVLTATVQTTVSGTPGLKVSRALSVQVNCVIDVDVFWFSDDRADDRADASAGDTLATEMARAMTEKVRGLTG